MVLQGSLFIMKGPKIDEKARYQMLNALVKVVSLKKQQLLTMTFDTDSNECAH